MKLTQELRKCTTDDFPTTQLFILALCRVAEPIALTSIFPYSWLMVKGFHVGNEIDASFYAGILISAFALFEALTGMWWGGLSDRIGRKPVLLLGCFGTVLSLLIVGFSQSFAMALFGRIIGGALNGNIGVIQTMVGELVKNPEHEPKAYSVMPFVWSIGTILGPAIGGMLAAPAKSFPDIVPKNSFLDRFPWLLPNVVCAIFMCLSILASYFFLEETHPDLRKGADLNVHNAIEERTPMIIAGDATADPGIDLRQESYGTFNEVNLQRHEKCHLSVESTPQSQFEAEKRDTEKWFTWQVAMLCVALGIFTYHAMCYDHLLPIFLQDEKIGGVSILDARSALHLSGGLGLTTKTVGLIMSVNGVIALFIQAIIFPMVAERLGVWRVFVLVTILHPVAYFVLPYTTLLPRNLLFVGAYTCLTIRNLFAILAYPVILILIKQASISPSVLGRINGLAASVGAACRTIAPPIAGLFYGLGKQMEFSAIAWWAAGLVALIGTAQIYFIPRESEPCRIRSLIVCHIVHDDDDVDKGVTKVATTEVGEEA